MLRWGVAEWPGARLRAFGGEQQAEAPVLLIIPAPFKRAYIWDLLPEVSVIRHCLRRDVRVYLLEWLIPGAREDAFGLAEYADSLPAAALDAIAAESGRKSPLMAGHSLGGTFAAIFASLWPERVAGLILVDAPLAFGARGGPLARVVAVIPHARLIRGAPGTPVSGSVINALSMAAAPDAFRVQPAMDLAASMLDPMAFAIHMRVSRWAHDEFPLPGQLFEDVLEQLYREDRFMLGTLQVGARRTGVASLRTPIIAVINPVGCVVPPVSILAGLGAAPAASPEVLEYEADSGPMIQHLGPLAARSAHERLWPKILDWAHQVARARADA